MMIMKGNFLSVFDTNKRLVIHANLSQNMTFRVRMSILKYQCFAGAVNRNEWLLHLKSRNLNFRDLHQLNQRNIVF